MARTQSDIGELVARIFDRLSESYPNAIIEDAMVVVEVSNPDDSIILDEGTSYEKEVSATTVMLESTTARVTVQVGMLQLGHETLAMDASDDSGGED
jgi:hypothetical protein